MVTVHERLATLAALTDRERQVMALVCRGLSNKQIARILSIADGTVKVHLHRIFDKLAIHNRTMLATMATESAGATTGSEQPASSPASVADKSKAKWSGEAGHTPATWPSPQEIAEAKR
jgi:DNA-binding CsgD family transcriptional regulator